MVIQALEVAASMEHELGVTQIRSTSLVRGVLMLTDPLSCAESGASAEGMPRAAEAKFGILCPAWGECSGCSPTCWIRGFTQPQLRPGKLSP